MTDRFVRDVTTHHNVPSENFRNELVFNTSSCHYIYATDAIDSLHHAFYYIYTIIGASIIFIALKCFAIKAQIAEWSSIQSMIFLKEKYKMIH